MQLNLFKKHRVALGVGVFLFLLVLLVAVGLLKQKSDSNINGPGGGPQVVLKFDHLKPKPGPIDPTKRPIENRVPVDAKTILKLGELVEQNPEELNRDTLDRYMEASFGFLEADQIKALEEFKAKIKKNPESSFQRLRQYYEELPKQRFDYRHAALELVGNLQFSGSQEFVESSYQENLDFLKSEEYQQMDSRSKTKAMTMPLAAARALAQTYENKTEWYESLLHKIEENPPDPIQRFLIINLLTKNPQSAEYKEKIARVLPISKKYMIEGL